MFKLVAFLLLVTNGVQAEKPSGALTLKQTFESEKECKSYLGSKKGSETKKALEELVKSKKGALNIGIACIKAADKSKDNSI